jgi:hypothetical protein
MDGVPNVNDPVTYESNKTQYTALPISVRRRKSRNVYDSGADLDVAVSDVDISESGRHLDKMHKELEKIEDPKARERAKKGFETVMRYIAGQTHPGAMRRYLGDLDEFRKNDKETFRDLFTAAGALIEGGIDLQRWIKAFHGMAATETQKAYIRETMGFLGENRSIELLVGVTEMLGNREAEEQFFAGLEKMNEPERKKSYMEKYTTT